MVLPHLDGGDPWAKEDEEEAALPGTATPLVAEALELPEPSAMVLSKKTKARPGTAGFSCTCVAFEARNSRRQQRKAAQGGRGKVEQGCCLRRLHG